MAEQWNKLQVAQIPSIPVQEAEAESQRLTGADTVESPAAPYAVPATTGTDDQDTQSLAGAGSSSQVPTGPDIGTGSSDERHEHYWIHTVTETIERGYADGEAYSLAITKGEPYRIFGLDDLRNRAALFVAPTATNGGFVAFGKRDRIYGADPASGFQVQSGGVLDVRSRNEWFVVYLPASGDPDVIVINVVEYHSERAEDVLGKQQRG